MAKADTKTKMLADGLRYKSKVSGSPFTAATSFGAATMSCFLCGKHRARSQMSSRKILGKSQAVCAPSCKEAEAALAASS
jgi:disulfide bond formation protein DsbB